MVLLRPGFVLDQDFISRDKAGDIGGQLIPWLMAAGNFGRAAFEAVVKRIIYLGGLGGSDTELFSHLAPASNSSSFPLCSKRKPARNSSTSKKS